MKSIRIKSNTMIWLLLMLFLLPVLPGCKKYEEGPAFSLLPVRVRIANKWKSVDYDSLHIKFTPFGKYKVSDNGEDWKDGGDWSFEEKRDILEIDGRRYFIRRLTNKELWIVDFTFGEVLKYESESFI